MRTRLLLWLVAITALLAFAVHISLPATSSVGIGNWRTDTKLAKGLDLQGGVSLIYEADTSAILDSNVKTSMQQARAIIERRVNSLGVSEPEIRIGSLNGRQALFVDLPGVTDLEQAKSQLGSTANLQLLTPSGEVVIEGKHLVPGAAVAEPAQSANLGGLGAAEWQVRVTFNQEGKERFAAATSAPEQVGQPIYILLDTTLISAPVVQEPITDGIAVITGGFDPRGAREFANTLNFGALPVPLKLVSEASVGASLGDQAIAESVFAGIVGLGLVALIMIAYYRFLGLLAVGALLLYTLLNVASFKLFGITLTLAGIAAFVISIGVAVDTNILTFERLREELADGKQLGQAVTESFRRSWPSIRDAHVASFITGALIFLLGSGGVRGFALVLLIGTAISLFTAITVVRTWMQLLAQSRFARLLTVR